MIELSQNSFDLTAVYKPNCKRKAFRIMTLPIGSPVVKPENAVYIKSKTEGVE
jgi:hypothetical protein